MSVLSAEWQRSVVQTHQVHGTETLVRTQNMFPDVHVVLVYFRDILDRGVEDIDVKFFWPFHIISLIHSGVNKQLNEATFVTSKKKMHIYI